MRIGTITNPPRCSPTSHCISTNIYWTSEKHFPTYSESIVVAIFHGSVEKHPLNKRWTRNLSSGYAGISLSTPMFEALMQAPNLYVSEPRLSGMPRKVIDVSE